MKKESVLIDRSGLPRWFDLVEFDADLDNEKHRNRTDEMRNISTFLSLLFHEPKQSLNNFLAQLSSERKRLKFYLRSEKFPMYLLFDSNRERIEKPRDKVNYRRMSSGCDYTRYEWNTSVHASSDPRQTSSILHQDTSHRHSRTNFSVYVRSLITLAPNGDHTVI